MRLLLTIFLLSVSCGPITMVQSELTRTLCIEVQKENMDPKTYEIEILESQYEAHIEAYEWSKLFRVGKYHSAYCSRFTIARSAPGETRIDLVISPMYSDWTKFLVWIENYTDEEHEKILRFFPMAGIEGVWIKVWLE